MCYLQHMRTHIEMDDALIRRIDAVAGRRMRSQFVREAVEVALDQAERTRRLLASSGSIPDQGHAWDDDPAGWVRAQRRGDVRRVG